MYKDIHPDKHCENLVDRIRMYLLSYITTFCLFTNQLHTYSLHIWKTNAAASVAQ